MYSIATKLEPDVTVTVEEWVVQSVGPSSRVTVFPNSTKVVFELISEHG